MAFTAAQELTICTILGITPTSLDNHFDVFAYDADIETAVETELTRWETAKSNFTKIHPRERNFGAEINPGNEKDDIRKNVALLLGFDLNALGFGNSRLVRA